MSEELPPSLFNILRGDLRDTRTEINGRLDGLARDMVTSAMLAQVQSNQKERDDRQDARLRELEGAQDDARKTKAQQWFAIGLAGLGAIGSIIGGVILNAMNGGA